jgi:hypothetical protein
MLVDPVAHQAADDALVPPGLTTHVFNPGSRGVPVVADVVVVEDHRHGDRREHPADHRVRPGLSVQPRVLLEVGNLVRWRAVLPSALGNELLGLRRDVVGIDLVSEKQQRIRPLVGRQPSHPQAV